ncbi:MAG: hypothetical protein MUP16_08325 [Sedimentisphaerales bacterium]|nr:hypothetical protein [Sedimentisphaerales bacterium]
MAIGKTIMDNSILPILPGLHATILSIFLAALVAYSLYSYQVLNNLTEHLKDLRTQVAQIMSGQSYIGTGSIKAQEYLKNGTLDFLKLRKELWFTLHMGDEKYIKQNAERILHIISLFAMMYPYSDRASIDEKGGMKIFSEPKKLEYDAKWKDDLISLNGYLSWMWEGSSKEILDLMSKYQPIRSEEEIKQKKVFQEKMIQDIKRGITDPARQKELVQGIKQREEEEIQRMREQMNKYGTFESLRKIEGEIPFYIVETNYSKIVSDFFGRVKFIESNIVPFVRDYSYKLDFFENKFRIKKYLVFALVFSLIMLFAGIFLPLFINLYWKPPYIKSVEVGFLIGTLLPYFIVLLLFLKQTLELKFK